LGTFYYPRVVYNNVQLLRTNSQYYLRQGYSEIFKYGLLRSRQLIRLLEDHRGSVDQAGMQQLIRRSIDARVDIRKQDPLASNLGHTFGHAIEKLSDFRILHGDAISAGTVMALHYAKRKGLMDGSVVGDIVAMMRRLNLNVYFDRSTKPDAMVQLMLRDKKSSSTSVNLVLIRDIGVPYIENGSPFYRTSPQDVEDFLRDYFAAGEFAKNDCGGFLLRDEIYSAE
jgi:3-dehydroquinate synthase